MPPSIKLPMGGNLYSLKAQLLRDFPATVISPKLSANFKFNQPIYYSPYYACLLCILLCVANK